MTPTELKDTASSLALEGLRLVLALLVCIAIYLIFVGFAMALECQDRPDRKSYWSYRIIDGSRCWYRGEGRKPKSSLHWPDEPKPKREHRDPVFNAIRAEASALDAVTWNMKRPFDQASPINPPLLYNPSDIPEPECCWPDLSEFERRFVGMQQ